MAIGWSNGEVLLIKSIQQFNDVTSLKENLVFVNFGYSQCKICKATRRQWLGLSKDRPEILVAEVDCIKNNDICDAENIRKFPSLVLYLQGQVVKEYPDWQPRKKFHFKKFIDEFVNPQSAFKGKLLHLTNS